MTSLPYYNTIDQLSATHIKWRPNAPLLPYKYFWSIIIISMALKQSGLHHRNYGSGIWPFLPQCD